MMKARICASCKEPTVIPVSREMKIFNSVYHCKCQNCGSSVDLVPPASIGLGVMVGLSVLVFWAFVLFHGSGSPGFWALTIYLVACCALAAVWVPEGLKYWLFPAAPDELAVTDIQASGSNYFVARMVALIEKMGFLSGLIVPVAFILGVLGVASLIGYVNFIFFE